METTEACVSKPHLDKSSPEYMKLAARPPLLTMSVLAIGPILSQLTNALYGIITTIWVSKSIGELGMSAISTYSAFDQIGRSFGAFLSVSASTQISSLYGAGKGEEAGQVVSDLIRVSIICGCIIPAIMVPSVRPAAEWFNATEEAIKMGFEYILPLLICSFSSVIYMMIGGCLQGEGRTMLYAIQQIVCLVLNMALFAPLFLFCTKWGIRSASIATLISEAIPTSVVIGMLYTGKFSTKANWRGLFRKFSPYTWPAVKVGVSQLISNLSIMLPSIFVRKFLGMSLDQADYNDAMAGYNAATRTTAICTAVDIGVTCAFLPTASYALAAHKYSRWLWVLWHSVWINFCWGGFTMILTWAIPGPLSQMYSSGDSYMKWAKPMLSIMNGIGCLTGIRYNATSVLQSLKKGTTAMLLSLVTHFGSIIAFAAIMYYTDKTDTVRIIWCYSLASCMALVVGGSVVFSPIRKVYLLSKVEESSENPLEEIDKEDEDDDSSFKSGTHVVKIEPCDSPTHSNITTDTSDPDRDKIEEV